MTDAAAWLDRGQDVILATIIASSGSVPRGAGARMVVTAGGSVSGTIGGGAVEYRVQQMAAQALIDKQSQITSFALSPGDKEGLGMVCGGDVTVHIQYIPSGDAKARALFKRGVELFSRNTDSWIVTDITDGSGWGMEIYTEDDAAGAPNGHLPARPSTLETNGKTYYSEPLTRAGRVYVFGGGHISRELVPLLARLGFSCAVFDSLPAFASKEALPDADALYVGDFENISGSVMITENDYVVIMTRGHAFDFAVQAQALRLRPRYIGVIGSRKKIAFVSQKLRELGFSQAEIDSVRTPIGLDIGADTPAEIAVSIAAELIMARAGRINKGNAFLC
jgi:xanthine dehydrogenase accessory factor